MRRIFQDTAEFKSAVDLFENRLDGMDASHKDFLLITNVNGEALFSLNDIVGIVRMPFGENKKSWAILYYFTELEIPENIKATIGKVFDELFYSA